MAESKDTAHTGKSFGLDGSKVNVEKQNADNSASDFLKSFVSQQFGLVRVLVEDDKILFCGSDVAKALGYKRPNDAISQHCRGAVKHRSPISGKMQDINFIPESDIYRLIIRSKLPSAEQFEKWVFDEVLPSIRKHGAYMTSDTLDRMISSPEFGIKLLTALKGEREKNKKMKEENERLQLENQGLTHQTMTWDNKAILNSLMRSLARTSFHNNFRYAYNTLYKELRYKKGISLSNRPGKERLLNKIRDNEWNDVMEVAIALCKQSDIDVGKVINEVNAERVIEQQVM